MKVMIEYRENNLLQLDLIRDYEYIPSEKMYVFETMKKIIKMAREDICCITTLKEDN